MAQLLLLMLAPDGTQIFHPGARRLLPPLVDSMGGRVIEVNLGR